jgi:hypothetical protein
MTPGRVAYEAYGKSRGWRTAIGGAMPAWGEQRADLQQAWETAAIAVKQMPRDIGIMLQDLVDTLGEIQSGPFATASLEVALRHLRGAVAALIAHREHLRRLQVPEGPQG